METAPENASNDPIYGPADSVYEGLKYKLLLEFPASYLYFVPRVRFVTPFDSFGKALKYVINAKNISMFFIFFSSAS